MAHSQDFGRSSLSVKRDDRPSTRESCTHEAVGVTDSGCLCRVWPSDVVCVTPHFPCVRAVSRLFPERARGACVLGHELTGVSSLTRRLKRCPRKPILFQFLVFKLV